MLELRRYALSRLYNSSPGNFYSVLDDEPVFCDGI
jgi:hypothetical protein